MLCPYLLLGGVFEDSVESVQDALVTVEAVHPLKFCESLCGNRRWF